MAETQEMTSNNTGASGNGVEHTGPFEYPIAPPVAKVNMADNVIYINNLPTTDEGHDLTWTYETVKGTGALKLKCDFYTGVAKADWADISRPIDHLLAQKRAAWRKMLRDQGPVQLLPTPDGNSAYTYEA